MVSIQGPPTKTKQEQQQQWAISNSELTRQGDKNQSATCLQPNFNFNQLQQLRQLFSSARRSASHVTQALGPTHRTLSEKKTARTEPSRFVAAKRPSVKVDNFPSGTLPPLDFRQGPFYHHGFRPECAMLRQKEDG